MPRPLITSRLLPVTAADGPGGPPAAAAAAAARHRLLDGIRRLGLAVSGGADSIALLYLLLPLCRRAGITPVVLHFNHALRGAAAAADARFAERAARTAGAAFITATRQEPVPHPGGRTEARAFQPPGQSLEMAARAARLAFFADCVREASLDAVATGHQADDVAETLLLRLARGAGAAGLAGLRPASALEIGGTSLRLIRPLIGIRHQTLCQWLAAQGHPWREDASNRDTRIARNALRHDLLPQLADLFGTDLVPAINRSAAILRAEDDYLDTMAAAWLDRHTVPAGTAGTAGAGAAGTAVPAGTAGAAGAAAAGGTAPAAPPGAAAAPQGTPAATCQPRLGAALPATPCAAEPLALRRRLLRLWLLRQGYAAAAGFDTIEAIIERLGAAQPWKLTLPGNQPLAARGGWLFIDLPGVPPAPPGPVTLPVPGVVAWLGLTATVSLASGIVRRSGHPGQWPAACSLDAAAVGGRPLTLRSRRPGDRIEPLGMAGSRRLQDILVDAKLPRFARDHLPLLFCGETLAWVPGYRIARPFAVRDENTPAIQIRIAEGEGVRRSGDPGAE